MNNTNERKPLLNAVTVEGRYDVHDLVKLEDQPTDSVNSVAAIVSVPDPSILGRVLLEIKSRPFWRAMLAESLGTAVLIAVGLGTVATVLMALILMFDPVSGAHFNPAVSIGLCVHGVLDIIKLPFYILAQLSGASLACCYLLLIVPEPLRDDYFGVTTLGPGVTQLQAVVIEMTLTGALVITILALGIQPAKKKLQSPFLAPLGVCAVLLACMLFGTPLTGASMNPARSFGPALVLGFWENHWVYWVGPVSGSLCAVVMSRMLFHMKE